MKSKYIRWPSDLNDIDEIRNKKTRAISRLKNQAHKVIRWALLSATTTAGSIALSSVNELVADLTVIPGMFFWFMAFRHAIRYRVMEVYLLFLCFLEERYPFS